MGVIRISAVRGRQGQLTVDEPEKCTSGETATKEGQEGGDENGGPDGNAATEVSAGAHVVVLRSLAR